MPEVLIGSLITAGQVDVKPTQPAHKTAYTYQPHFHASL